MRALPLLLIFACTDTVGLGSQAVVYGVDDRTDVYAHASAAWRDRTVASIVALIPHDELDVSDPDNVLPVADTLAVHRDLCDGERFAEQPTAASCSGTLIDNDLVLTAGHCVETTAECQRRSYVFNYLYKDADVLATIEFDRDVYECAELVTTFDDGGIDYGIVRLDRAVDPSHAPAPIRTEDTALGMDDALVVIGFGSGIPAKIDDGGEVLAPRAATLDYFGANLDTFGGNSGSGVFTAAGSLTGILVRGETDYVDMAGCNIVNVLDERPTDPEELEECTYVARALAGLCDTGFVTDLCGDTEGWCRVCRDVGDCPLGWSCAAVEGATRYCLAPCTIPTDCRAGHSCESGRCEPVPELMCVGEDVTSVRCGRVAATREACAPSAVCIDAACTPAAPGNYCGDPIEVAAENQTLTGTHGVTNTSAARGSCGGASSDTVITFTTTERTRFTASSEGFDTILHLRSVCDSRSSEIACNDDFGVGDGSRIRVALDPGTYFLWVDGWGSEEGMWTLDLDFVSLVRRDAGVDAAVVDADSGVDAAMDAGSDAAMDAGVGIRDVGIPDARDGEDAARADSAVDVEGGLGGGAGCSVAGGFHGLWLILLVLLSRRRF